MTYAVYMNFTISRSRYWTLNIMFNNMESNGYHNFRQYAYMAGNHDYDDDDGN